MCKNQFSLVKSLISKCIYHADTPRFVQKGIKKRKDDVFNYICFQSVSFSLKLSNYSSYLRVYIQNDFRCPVEYLYNPSEWDILYIPFLCLDSTVYQATKLCAIK